MKLKEIPLTAKIAGGVAMLAAGASAVMPNAPHEHSEEMMAANASDKALESVEIDDGLAQRNELRLYVEAAFEQLNNNRAIEAQLGGFEQVNKFRSCITGVRFDLLQTVDQNGKPNVDDFSGCLNKDKSARVVAANL